MKRSEDQLIKEILSTSKLEVPTNDFEVQVMMQINQAEVHHKQVIPREIKWSWVLMGLIIVLGVTTSILFTYMPTVVFDIPLYRLKTVFDFGFVTFVLLQLDSLIKYTFHSEKLRLNNALKES